MLIDVSSYFALNHNIISLGLNDIEFHSWCMFLFGLGIASEY